MPDPVPDPCPLVAVLRDSDAAVSVSWDDSEPVSCVSENGAWMMLGWLSPEDYTLDGPALCVKHLASGRLFAMLEDGSLRPMADAPDVA